MADRVAETSVKTVVTGASGFLGRALLDCLLARGDEVLAFSRKPLAHSTHRNLTWRDFDLEKPFAWASALDGASVVYHLAWTSLPHSSNADPERDAGNVLGTIRLLEGARSVPGIKVVFASSGGTVYGRLDNVPALESSPKNPLCAYGVSKLAAEHYLDLYRRLWDVDTLALRIGNLYGVGQGFRSNFGAVTNFASHALRGDAIHIWGDGETVRDYVHVDDAVAALVLAAKANTSGGAINIGAGEGRSLNAILASLTRLVGPVPVVYEPARDFDVPVSVLDIQRAARDLNWAPTVEFESGLSALVDCLRDQLAPALATSAR